MEDGKFDLPDDLLPSKIGSDHSPKDQQTSENSIPLSPQWLYSKAADAKMFPAGASWDIMSPNLLPNGASGDPNLKDSWRLDGSQDKKEWRRAASDLESSLHWREEERETSFLQRWMFLKIGTCCLLNEGQMLVVVVQGLNLEEKISGLQDGVLKRKKRILEMRRGQMLRRKMPLLRNKLLLMILVINGGHVIIWKFMQVGAVLQVSAWRGDEWRNQM